MERGGPLRAFLQRARNHFPPRPGSFLALWVEYLLAMRFELVSRLLDGIREPFVADTARLRARLVEAFGGERVANNGFRLAINAVDAHTGQVVRYVTAETALTTPTASVGADRFYDIIVFGVNDVSPAWQTFGFSLANSTNIAYGGIPLQSGKLYQWDIYQAEAQTLYGSPSAPYSAAIAYANGGGLVPAVPAGSLNGPFNFTTPVVPSPLDVVGHIAADQVG